MSLRVPRAGIDAAGAARRRSPAEFIRRFPCHPLSVEEKATIVDQAILMFKHLYPHLPFKQQQFTFADPIQQLQELRIKLATTREAQAETNWRLSLSAVRIPGVRRMRVIDLRHTSESH